MTPESITKKKIKKLLDNYGSGIYIFMPVPGGFGAPSLDYLGCLYGRFFAIEAKAPKRRPTPRQERTIELMEASGAKVFVIDGDVSELERWLSSVCAEHAVK